MAQQCLWSWYVPRSCAVGDVVVKFIFTFPGSRQRALWSQKVNRPSESDRISWSELRAEEVGHIARLREDFQPDAWFWGTSAGNENRTSLQIRMSTPGRSYHH